MKLKRIFFFGENGKTAGNLDNSVEIINIEIMFFPT